MPVNRIRTSRICFGVGLLLAGMSSLDAFAGGYYRVAYRRPVVYWSPVAQPNVVQVPSGSVSYSYAPVASYSLPTYGAASVVTYGVPQSTVSYSFNNGFTAPDLTTASAASAKKVSIHKVGNTLKAYATQPDGTLSELPLDGIDLGGGSGGGDGGGSGETGTGTAGGSIKSINEICDRLDKKYGIVDGENGTIGHDDVKLTGVNWSDEIKRELKRRNLPDKALERPEREILDTAITGLRRQARARRFRNPDEFRRFLRESLETARDLAKISSPDSRAIAILDLISRVIGRSETAAQAASLAAGQALPPAKSLEESLDDLVSGI